MNRLPSAADIGPAGDEPTHMAPCEEVDVERRVLWHCRLLVVVSAFFWGWALYNMVGPKKMGLDGGIICT